MSERIKPLDDNVKRFIFHYGVTVGVTVGGVVTVGNAGAFVNFVFNASAKDFNLGKDKTPRLVNATPTTTPKVKFNI